MERKTVVKGTTGYEKVVQKFISATNSIDFKTLHQDFMDFILLEFKLAGQNLYPSSNIKKKALHIKN